jgi:1-acyl-sn-glycerol-3-phosphate acyltransferase
VPLLYDAVALGMGAYTRTAFRVATLGGESLRLRPGTLVVVTHRRETDVPLLCPSLYRWGRMWEDRGHRIAFAARDDMHEPGFFAGFPPSLPTWLRRVVFPITIGDLLRSSLLVHPLRSAAIVRLNDVFRQLPDLELRALPHGSAEALRARAAEVGHDPPVRGRDVLRGEYADLLWRAYGRGELDGAAVEPVWSRRAALATADFRALVELVRRGAVLVVFPEGRPSPGGEIGPLQPGLGALVRRAAPRWIQPVGIAYDPLSAGRTRALVAFTPAVAPPAGDVAATFLGLLRAAVPLTAGQVTAHAVARGECDPAAIAAELAAAVERSSAEGRHVEPGLEREATRVARVAEGIAAAARRGRDVAYLAREYESARASSL